MFERDGVNRPRGPGWAIRRMGNGFASGICLGFAALPLIFTVSVTAPRHHGEGIAGDWRAVGGLLRRSMREIDPRNRSR